MPTTKAVIQFLVSIECIVMVSGLWRRMLRWAGEVWDADGVSCLFEDDEDGDYSSRASMAEYIYISILAMAPPHRPSDVLPVRARLAVPAGRASIALRVGGADSVYVNENGGIRTASSSPKSIATFGYPRTANKLKRLVDLRWHRRAHISRF